METLMTAKEAAGYLKLNYMTAYKLAQRGKIPATKVVGNWRFKKEILDEWIAKQAAAAHGEVLVVDDDPRVREVLEEVISAQGYRVVAVGTGEEALEEVEKRHYDLIFLDLVLPGISGAEVLAAIKEKDKRAVVAIVTGYGDDPIAMEAMAMGPLLLIRKPFKPEDIREVLNVVIRAKR